MSIQMDNKEYKDLKWSFSEEDLLSYNFNYNNFIKKFEVVPAVLERMSNANASIWLNIKGDICYRLNTNEDICITSQSKASIAISNLLNINIIIGRKKESTFSCVVTSDEPFPPMYLCTNDLLCIFKEEFRPDIRKEFFNKSPFLNSLYRNTFIPSPYVGYFELFSTDYLSSTIGEYIFYLAGHEENRFHCIMSWLATFFQDFSARSSHILVLIGNDGSGIEILFEEIIKPLFGEIYCSKLNDERLLSNNVLDFINEKLFYNIDRVTKKSLKNEEIEMFLKNICSDDNSVIDIKHKNNIIETKIYGQTLVTTNELYLPFLDRENNNYTVFKVQDNIEVNFEPIVTISDNRSKIEKKELVQRIRDDLENFSNILTRYIPSVKLDIQDDKGCIIVNEEDRLKEFSHAIVNRTIEYFDKLKYIDNTLYQDIITGFENNQIKQPNIMECYRVMYGGEGIQSPKTLMKKLREFNSSFFNIEAILHLPGGTKYFKYKP